MKLLKLGEEERTKIVEMCKVARAVLSSDSLHHATMRYEIGTRDEAAAQTKAVLELLVKNKLIGSVPSLLEARNMRGALLQALTTFEVEGLGLKPEPTAEEETPSEETSSEEEETSSEE